MQIKLKNLKLVNFKGVELFEADFKHVTNIYGENGAGKTTLFDAFLWLFFGKNSEGISQFGIKRIDPKTETFIENIETEVSATLQLDQQEVVAKKVLRQKWVKRRGELESNYAGDENIYFWNDVPMKEGEFKTKIKDIVDENLFRLITNPYYFNSLKWQERRNILIDIAGDISNDEILDTVITVANKGQYNGLIAALNQGKSLDEYKRELAAKKTKIKDEAESIPSRIDEVRRGMPKDLNFETIKTQLDTLKTNAAQIQNSLDSEVSKVQEEHKRQAEILNQHNKKVQDHNQKTFSVKSELQNLEFDAKQKAKEQSGTLEAEIASLKRQHEGKESEMDRYSQSLVLLNTDIAKKEAEREVLITQYDSVDESQLVFNENQFMCPSCKRELPDADIEAKKEEIVSNFNKNKADQLESIRTKGQGIKSEIEALQARIANGESIISQLKQEAVSLGNEIIGKMKLADKPAQTPDEIISEILATNKEYQDKKKELISLSLTASGFVEPVLQEIKSASTDELKARRDQINTQIYELQKELAKEDQIKSDEERIKELREQEASLAQALAEFEGSEYAVLQFTKGKVDVIERRINGRFKEVKFKMFNLQVNGGESECCDTLVNTNGSFVPFTDANKAGQINSGIDIINTLCNHYNIIAPVFIDNRESVTQLIDSESQIVNLIVSSADMKLRVA